MPSHFDAIRAHAGRFRRWVRSVLFFEYCAIGIVDQPIANALTWQGAPPARWLPFDKKRYLADPFPWPGSVDTILCETYDIAAQLGSLAAIKIGAAGIIDEIKIDVPIAGHLSFPHLFQHEGRLFMMPESSAARRLEILRYGEEDGKWSRHATVFADKPVADAVLFPKDGLFWIAYTDITDDPFDNLNLVYAESLQGPWLEHPLNPVRRGREACRGAGKVFEVGGRLYRPAQDCSQIYGGAIRIMEIAACTPQQYQEREIVRLAPTSADYPDGFHTLNAWGDRCIVDGMRLIFMPRVVMRKIARRLRRVVGLDL